MAKDPLFNCLCINYVGYVFTRGGRAELPKKLSLPLGYILDRYILCAYIRHLIGDAHLNLVGNKMRMPYIITDNWI